MLLVREIVQQTFKFNKLAVCRKITKDLVRLGSYQKSKKVSEPSEYTDYETIQNPKEWKYVERLLPIKLIPDPKPKESYPSGWTPPTADPERIPYFVERTKNHMLPVYLAIGDRGMRRETKILKVEGDIWKLSDELVTYLKPLMGYTSIGCKVEEIKKKITLRGDFVEYTKKFLTDKGF